MAATDTAAASATHPGPDAAKDTMSRAGASGPLAAAATAAAVAAALSATVRAAAGAGGGNTAGRARPAAAAAAAAAATADSAAGAGPRSGRWGGGGAVMAGVAAPGGAAAGAERGFGGADRRHRCRTVAAAAGLPARMAGRRRGVGATKAGASVVIGRAVGRDPADMMAVCRGGTGCRAGHTRCARASATMTVGRD
ncbi:hypothetical protein I4F81_003552 [Pyropia yezoensis]|uniref:Uncharacterized protein n=1 Tax=Pyropia yezoensis TaxID=2788 RepID=A0ACC3BTC6_PYRYE|nr:hypothetical protein I4F81_003552 [Neopyropia yezoensis]